MRVIWCLSSVVSILLACRFLPALAGTHRASGSGQFITGSTAPLAAPFPSLFGQSATPAVPRLDASTLVALIVYALAAWGLAGLVGLVGIGRRQLR